VVLPKRLGTDATPAFNGGDVVTCDRRDVLR
jgi:hypothetical protein